MRIAIAPVVAGLALAFSGAAPALAATIYSNTFDTENGGLTATNYAAFTGISVTDGSVDLVHTGDGYGINCAGGPGGCVDLQGSTSETSRLDIASFSFAANTLYTFSFDLSGDQRGGGEDGWFVGVSYDSNNVYNFFRLGGAFGDADLLQGFATGGSSTGGSLQPSDGFQRYSIGFNLQNAGSATFYIGSNTPGNVGPILDNVLVESSSAAVPEPATWAMMIAGFGLVGGLMRRRTLALTQV